MNNKRIASIILSFVLFFNLLTASVQAMTNSTDAIYKLNDSEIVSEISVGRSSEVLTNVDIISEAPITVERAQEWAKQRNATEAFISLAPLFEKYAKERGGINWALAYVQAAKETGYGRFGGVLDASYHNTCGLKNPAGGSDYDPNAHKKFDNWDQGVIAHLDHLALYAGATDYPKSIYVDKWKEEALQPNETYDPRHIGWYSTNLYGKCKNVFDLGGRWAPSPTYGAEIFGLYASIAQAKVLPARSQLDSPKDGQVVKDNTLKVSGWALHPFGIREVKVSIDNKYLSKLDLNIIRNDVDKTYPGYFNGKNSGFEGTISLEGISNGTKELKVEVVATNGSTQTHIRNIIIQRESLRPIGRIDEPTHNETVKTDKITVRGWAAMESGVKEIKVYVDGVYKGTTTANQSRPDVGNAYPQYPNSQNAGFKVDINIKDIANGSRLITAEVIGNDGSKNILDRTINVSRYTLNPIGRIDEPTHNQTVRGNSVTVRGWAAMESGVKEIKIYVDGVYKGTTTANQSRPDVGNAYPKYPNSQNSGFISTVNISDIKAGNRVITAEVMGKDGSKNTLTRSINVVKSTLNPVGRIDEPTHNQTVRGNSVTVRGWAANESGVKEIKVYVDGVYKATTTANQSRPDVGNAYPQYPNSRNAGFKVDLNISDIKSGSRTITAEVIGKDGSKHILDRRVNVVKSTLSPIGRIDEPTHNQMVKDDTITVRGWAATESGVKEIKVYVDGVYKGITTANQSRPDVGNAYPQYPNSRNAGFKVDINIKDIATGSRLITAEVTGNDGSKHVLDRRINVSRNTLSPVGRIDEPTHNQAVKEDVITVRGWAAMSSGVKEIKIYVDGKYKVTTTANQSRPDVGNAYPQYPNSTNAGFKVDVNIKDIANGSRLITAEVIGNDGSKNTLSRTVNISRVVLDPAGRIDEPVDGKVVNQKSLKIRGWAVTQSGVKEIKVYIDDKYIGLAKIGQERNDIFNVYPQYPNSKNAGFELVTDVSKLTAGTKNIKAEVMGNDGSVNVLTRRFVIDNENYEIANDSLGRIDEPVVNTNHYKDSLFVRGWAINKSGIKQVSVYVNGAYKGDLKYGTSRPDVNIAYPGYPSGNNAGYEGYVDLSDVQEGKVNVLVKVISKDNKATNFTTTINLISKSQKVVMIDPGHENPPGDPGFISRFSGVEYHESTYNLEISEKLKIELEKQGVKVIMTRREGSGQIAANATDSLTKRVDMANEANVDFVVSIHNNGFTDPSANGFEVYYSSASPYTVGRITEDGRHLTVENPITRMQSRFTPKVIKSKEVAERMTKDVTSQLGIRNRGAKDSNFYIPKNTKMPSVLVECGFMTNFEDFKKISDPQYQQRLAKILADIIVQSI